MREFDPKKSRSFKIAWHHKTSFDLDDRFKSLASHLVEKKYIYCCVFYDYRFIDLFITDYRFLRDETNTETFASRHVIKFSFILIVSFKLRLKK